jgi:hypothetical protein
MAARMSAPLSRLAGAKEASTAWCCRRTAEHAFRGVAPRHHILHGSRSWRRYLRR